MHKNIGGHNPVVILIVAVLFYAAAVSGALTDTLVPKENYKIILFIFQCLPALLVFPAARVLHIPIILSLLLAVAGPLAVAMAYFGTPFPLR